MSSNGLNQGEVVIMEGGIQWASLVPHIILSLLTAGLWLIVLIYIAIVRSKTKITLTNKRLVGKVGGLFSSDTLDVPLNKVTAVKVENSALGNILGYATMQVSSSSGVMDFDYVKGAKELRNAINNQVEVYEEEKIKQQAAAMAKAMK